MPKGSRGGKHSSINDGDFIVKSKIKSNSFMRYREFQPERKTFLENYLGMTIDPPYVAMTANRVAHAQHHVSQGDELDIESTNRALRNGRVFTDIKHPGTLVFVDIQEDLSGSRFGAYVVLGVVVRPGRQMSGYLRMRNNYAISEENANWILREGKRKKNGKKEYKLIL